MLLGTFNVFAAVPDIIAGQDAIAGYGHGYLGELRIDSEPPISQVRQKYYTLLGGSYRSIELLTGSATYLGTTQTPVITFGTLSGAGTAQTVPVHISGSIPENSYLVVFRTSQGIWGPFWVNESPAAANDVVICERVSLLEAFLVSCLSSFMTGDLSVVYVHASWSRRSPTPTPAPVITFGTLSGTGTAQQVPVQISGSIPSGAYLVVIRMSPGVWGMFWGHESPAIASSEVMICDGVTRLDAFLVSCWSSFMMGDFSTVYAQAFWIRPVSTPTPTSTPTPPPEITFGTLSGTGTEQTVPVYISEPIPEGSYLVVVRSSPGIWGPFWGLDIPATASSEVVICSRVSSLTAFLVSCVSSFMMGDINTVYVQAVWFRPTPTPTPPPEITFGTLSGDGIGQRVPVYISGSIPEGSYLVVFRSSPGTWGPFWGIDIPATASSHVMICDRVSRLDAFLVSCWSSFMAGDTDVVYVQAVWARPTPT